MTHTRIPPRRRLFLFVSLGVLALGSVLACAAARTATGLVSGLLPGEKEVRNAKPTPPFVVEDFRDSAAVRFLVVGDWGTGATMQKTMANAMAQRADSTRPAFIISTGDNIYNNGVTSVDDPQWQTKFEAIYNQKALELPWYAILGNHDHRGSIQAQIDYNKKNPRWNMPARYFTFTRGTDSTAASTSGTLVAKPLVRPLVQFFMIDTDPIHRDEKPFIAEQSAWLKQVLDSSKAVWKIVVGHHPIRSSGAYGDQPAQIRATKPLLDSSGVALYMNGHDHDMQYHKIPTDPFYCLVSGNGGESRNTGYGEHTIFATTNGGFNVVAVTRERIYVEFVNAKAQPVFTHSIRKPLTVNAVNAGGAGNASSGGTGDK
jgi:tartrate-resistant acid phosphatase type 5